MKISFNLSLKIMKSHFKIISMLEWLKDFLILFRLSKNSIQHAQIFYKSAKEYKNKCCIHFHINSKILLKRRLIPKKASLPVAYFINC